MAVHTTTVTSSPILMTLLAAGIAIAGASAYAGRATPQPAAKTPTAKFAKIVGWGNEMTPRAPAEFVVDAIATDIDAPRWLYVLPNGDVLVAQSRTTEAPDVDADTQAALRAAGSLGPSPNRITLLRDADGDGKFETIRMFASDLKQPFGMALSKGFFYVANSNAVVRFAYREGADQLSGRPERILDLPAGGHHWTRSLVFNADGTRMYIGVGSQTNVDEEGLDARDPHRATILESSPEGTGVRVFASGLRNPAGLDWEPFTKTLWAAVNERDLLGDNLPDDYVTSVKDGGFYGWPHSYHGRIEDPRPKHKRPDLVTRAIKPDVLVGAHTAPLGLAFSRTASFPERYRSGLFVGQHGSWNRSKFSGYRVGFVPFADGRPAGPIEDFLTGFIASEERSEVYGRPVGVVFTRDGSLLVADDAGKRVWRIRPAEHQ